MIIHGKCHCGTITYQAEVTPGTVILCHCSDCQAFAGGPYRAMIRPAEGSVQMTGTPRHYVKTADSGNQRVQGFCGDCGCHLYAMDPDGGRLALRIGVIEQRHELGAPAAQVWCDSAFDWAFALPENGRNATQP